MAYQIIRIGVVGLVEMQETLDQCYEKLLEVQFWKMRKKAKLNLRIKEITLGLTYNERKRLETLK